MESEAFHSRPASFIALRPRLGADKKENFCRMMRAIYVYGVCMNQYLSI